MATTEEMSFDQVLAAEVPVPKREWPDTPAREAPLFLIDGNNLAHKAFHALPPETCRADGFPTGALLGFANMLARILYDFRPRAVVVCWDEKPARRLALSAAYKAHRSEMPDPLKQQFPFFEQIASAFACTNIRHTDEEADDVFATLARRASALGIKTCIVTNDRDAYQIIDDQVCVLATPKGFSDVQVYTAERVLERLGVRPDQVPDYLGLKGDPGDGISGVPGFGEKTASALIAQYGSLEALLASAHELKGKKRENLETFAEDARVSKVLATVLYDLELDIDLEALLTTRRDFSGLAATLEEFEFAALLARLRGRGLQV